MAIFSPPTRTIDTGDGREMTMQPCFETQEWRPSFISILGVVQAKCADPGEVTLHCRGQVAAGCKPRDSSPPTVINSYTWTSSVTLHFCHTVPNLNAHPANFTQGNLMNPASLFPSLLIHLLYTHCLPTGSFDCSGQQYSSLLLALPIALVTPNLTRVFA